MENPIVALNGWVDEKSFQVKGIVEYHTSGTLYEKGGDRAISGQRKFPGKVAEYKQLMYTKKQVAIV
jgi:hypothetical protein